MWCSFTSHTESFFYLSNDVWAPLSLWAKSTLCRKVGISGSRRESQHATSDAFVTPTRSTLTQAAIPLSSPEQLSQQSTSMHP